jgi:septal ring factor EnvC (AmiA/AmiB activator)
VTDDTTLQAMIYETRQDVRWIKDTLKEIKEANQAQDERIAEIKARQDKQTGRDGVIAVAISAVVAFFTALVSGGWLR